MSFKTIEQHLNHSFVILLNFWLSDSAFCHVIKEFDTCFMNPIIGSVTKLAKAPACGIQLHIMWQLLSDPTARPTITGKNRIYSVELFADLEVEFFHYLSIWDAVKRHKATGGLKTLACFYQLSGQIPQTDKWQNVYWKGSCFSSNIYGYPIKFYKLICQSQI